MVLHKLTAISSTKNCCRATFSPRSNLRYRAQEVVAFQAGLFPRKMLPETRLLWLKSHARLRPCDPVPGQPYFECRLGFCKKMMWRYRRRATAQAE
ncbi:unnamed protein product [Protopolystoma xenopodis]|uniref:Uncharacterized protein n=1 Tax=Protopolystoma xenopodis TaxID=117903 RepID=A0A448WEP9_9PLAT|nr:unnamed protein product [Protopolystoma xenopodis]